MLLGLSLIGYACASEQTAGFYGVDPSNGEALAPRYHSASPAELDRAASLASAAARPYAALGGRVHGAFLRGIAERLESLAAPLVERIPRETALPEARVRSELARTCAQLRLLATEAEAGHWVDARIERADPIRKPLPRPDTRSMLQPLGPVAIFAASNFPLAFSVAGGDCAAALAAGCPVIVKAHSAHPGTSELVGRAIVDAALALDLPEGVFSLLFDDGIELGRQLVQHPAIEAVGFTGSQRAGRALMDLAAARPRPIPVFAEMGSSNPVILLPQALASDAEAIADALASAIVQGNGQFCTKPGLIIAMGSVGFERLRQRLIDRLASVAPAAMLSAGLAATYRDGLDSRAAQTGVNRLLADHGGTHAVSAQLLEVDAATLLAQPALADELFGPVSLLVRCRDRVEVLQLLDSLGGQLTATVHADPSEMAYWPELPDAMARKAGRLLFGGVPTGVEVGLAMVHGGPYPAASDSRSTSVGTAAMLRFARPVCYQNWPDKLLPAALQDGNPLGLRRLEAGHGATGPQANNSMQLHFHAAT
ncbi:aldehyde dehydrogenase (NADP(+)) [Chitinimonas sp.]|uniref:aldehyde dehydrogenase (NADP(+)) n=1 Tax=Chitinimonas sp. TaxID=1934313 RepID=UPI0035B43F9C